MKLVSFFAGGIAGQFSSSDCQKFDENDLDEFIAKEFKLGTVGDVAEAYNLAHKIATLLIAFEQVLSGDGVIALELLLRSAAIIEDSQLECFFVDADKVKKKEREILEETFAQTVRLINQHQAEIKKIADPLYEKGTITGQKVYDILGKEVPLLDFQYDRMVNEVEQYFNYQ